MATDWKDALRALGGELPQEEASDDTAPEEPAAPTARKKTKLSISMERKGRKGKTATIIYGFECGDEELEEIARTLKTKIGTGGSARGGEILLQGEWRDRAAELLRELGFRL